MNNPYRDVSLNMIKFVLNPIKHCCSFIKHFLNIDFNNSFFRPTRVLVKHSDEDSGFPNNTWTIWEFCVLPVYFPWLFFSNQHCMQTFKCLRRISIDLGFRRAIRFQWLYVILHISRRVLLLYYLYLFLFAFLFVGGGWGIVGFKKDPRGIWWPSIYPTFPSLSTSTQVTA